MWWRCGDDVHPGRDEAWWEDFRIETDDNRAVPAREPIGNPILHPDMSIKRIKPANTVIKLSTIQFQCN